MAKKSKTIKTINVKSAEKMDEAQTQTINAAVATPSAAPKVSRFARLKSGSVAIIFWLLMAAFIAAICWTIINFERGLNPKQAAQQIANVAKTKSAPVVAEPVVQAEPVVVVPEIDTRVAVVANAVVLTDEQKEQKAQEYILSGVDMLNAGKADLALSEFNSAIALFPNFAPSYVYRGEALFQKTDFAGAMESFETAIAMEPNLTTAWFDKSTLQVKLGDADGALASINSAIDAYNNAPEINKDVQVDELYRKRAQLYLWASKWLEAVHDYTMAASFAKSLGKYDFMDVQGRADAKAGLGDFAGALKDYDEVIRSIATLIGEMKSDEDKADSATTAMDAFEKRAAIKLRLVDIDGAKEDIQGAIVLADAIGDTERKESLESSLAQLP
ncbi:MAG: tetratricopeptide repeat protein [Rickettsiales bacterium]|nr:tetratricopeptide repeat protein [Rickettsiales bacterium]